jgi:hypothetical protein
MRENEGFVKNNWLTPKAHASATTNKGWASYADEPIKAGETVATFGGWVVDFETLQTMPAERVGRSMQVDADLFMLSAESREPGDCINHSCEPNCGIQGSVTVVALRDISVGEELTFDYAMSDAAAYDEFDCACEVEMCRGKVRGTDWQLPELQERYAGLFSSYVQKLINQAN